MKIFARILARLCFVLLIVVLLFVVGVSIILAFLLELCNKSIDFLAKICLAFKFCTKI